MNGTREKENQNFFSETYIKNLIMSDQTAIVIGQSLKNRFFYAWKVENEYSQYNKKKWKIFLTNKEWLHLKKMTCNIEYKMAEQMTY